MSQVRVRWGLWVPARDGTRLAADLYLPPSEYGDGPFPTIVERSPYSKQRDHTVELARDLAKDGFAVLCQDVRGRYDSEGTWSPFRNEGSDGFDTIEWAAAQPWSNGRVGTMGGSYGGWVQWAAAALKPPHLVTIVAFASVGRWLTEAPYRNGLFTLPLLGYLHRMSARVEHDAPEAEFVDAYEHLPLRTMDAALGRDLPIWREWLDHPRSDDYWAAQSLTAADLAGVDVSALHITGWYDVHKESSLFYYHAMCEHSPAGDRQSLLVGPWDHDGCRRPTRSLGGIDFGHDAAVDMLATHRDWFRAHLDASDRPGDRAPARVFVTGGGGWQTSPSWPPNALDESWFLRDGARLTQDAPGRETADSFRYDPMDPVRSPEEGDSGGEKVHASLDRSEMERRPDVLTFSSAILERPLTVQGRPVLVLYGGSDACDTDWVVSVTDVRPDGRSVLLCDGVLRSRFREGLDREVWLRVDTAHEMTIKLGWLAHVFQPGHQVRLRVTSSDFPTYARNLNRASDAADETSSLVATNTVWHDEDRPSRLVLPVQADV